MHRDCILVLLGLSVALLCSCEKNPAREQLQRMDVKYSKKEFLKRVEQSDYDVVELFLAAGMNPDAGDKEGATALMYAAREGNLKIVKLLMEKGADVNVNADGGTALGWAVGGLGDNEREGHAEVIRFLVEHGADVNASAPLISAARCGDLEIVRLLVEHGADVNAKVGEFNRTALMFAAQYAPPEVVRYLLEHGADPNAEMVWPKRKAGTALEIAEENKRPEVVKILKEAGARERK